MLGRGRKYTPLYFFENSKEVIKMQDNVLKKALEKKKQEIIKAIRENIMFFLDGDVSKKEGIINALKRYESIIKTLQKGV